MTHNEIQQPGFYWYRKDDRHRWSIFEVFKTGQYWMCAQERVAPSTHNFVANFDGEWVGPIMKPSVDEGDVR